MRKKLNSAKSGVDFQQLISPHAFTGHHVVIINPVELNILIGGRKMKMLRSLVGDQFAKEVHLDRPPRTIGERIFRFSVYFFIASSIAGGLAEFAGVDKKIGDSMGFLMWPLSGLFLFSLIYMLAFAYLRYVRPMKAPRAKVVADSEEPIHASETTRGK